MKDVRFTNLRIENFGKHTTPIESPLGQRTLISGANEVGKSTIKRAIQYILGSKDENGKEITGIRPHDENGADIDGLTTTAELIVSVDGQENTLKRTCFQEKNRQGEYTGRDNLQYFIDDVKKGTKKAYDEFVSSFLPNMVCISAQEFLSKDTAGRRAMLEVFSEHDTDSIIDENAEFEPIRAKLKANSVSDLKKACRDKIKKQEKERDSFPARIDEIEKQKVDIDVAELELQRNALKEQIAENKAKQEDISKQFAEYDKLTDGIMELKFELSDLERKANEENNKKHLQLQNELEGKEYSYNGLLSTISDIEARIKIVEESELPSLEKELQEKRKLYTSISAENIDEDKYICPTCHRELPEKEKEDILSNFENMKRQRIDFVISEGNKVKKALEGRKQYAEATKKQLADCETLKKVLLQEMEELKQQLSALPQSIDISDLEDVKAIKQKIAEKEIAMKKANSGAEIRQKLKDECEDLQEQLNEVNSKIALAENNIKIDERVAELQKEQRDLSQKIADIERELDLLKQFERRKAELLEEDLNKNCEFIRFKMSELQQNGELKDICQILVNGESYDRNLNFSNRLLAEVDICRMFQRKFDVQLPILLDNAESIDKDRLPNIPNQLILFQRADNKELKIETIK